MEQERESAFKEIFETVKKGKVLQYDRFYRRQDNESVWVNMAISPVYDGGKLEGICITGSDITERKRIEEKLEKN